MKHLEVRLPSNRKFGLFFTLIFVAIAVFFYFDHKVTLSSVMGVLAITFGAVTYLKDELLLPLNKIWMRLGLILGMIVSPVVLGIMFFGIFTPIAFFMRIVGRDELRLKKRYMKSYWKQRDSNVLTNDSFKHQF